MRPHQTKKFFHNKGNHQKELKKQLMEWEKIFVNYIPEKELVIRIYKELIKRNGKKFD